MKQYIFLAIGALIGGIIGYTRVLCPDGSCPLTGSWFGGAVVGGLLALSFAGFKSGGNTCACRPSLRSWRDDQPPPRDSIPPKDG